MLYIDLYNHLYVSNCALLAETELGYWDENISHSEPLICQFLTHSSTKTSPSKPRCFDCSLKSTGSALSYSYRLSSRPYIFGALGFAISPLAKRQPRPHTYPEKSRGCFCLKDTLATYNPLGTLTARTPSDIQEFMPVYAPNCGCVECPKTFHWLCLYLILALPTTLYEILHLWYDVKGLFANFWVAAQLHSRPPAPPGNCLVLM